MQSRGSAQVAVSSAAAAAAGEERSTSGQGSVSVSGLSKEFRRRGGDRVTALDDVTLTVNSGQLVVLLGPSGSGKTTLLRCIAGLESPDRGRIEISGRCVFDSEKGIALPAERRGLSMMFQTYALWPHMTAYENVRYALRSRRVDRNRAATRAVEALAQAQVDELRDQYPSQMSGGQQQRVALARSLAVNPQVVLFDEPLSNVDAKVRTELRSQLVLSQREVGFAGVYVTHDQTEALQLADQVAVMGDGRIHQIDTPEKVYRSPNSRYVATFVGQANAISGTVVGPPRHTQSGWELGISTPLGTLTANVDQGADYAEGHEVEIVIRPEDISLSKSRIGPNSLQARIEAMMFSGSYTDYHAMVADQPLQISSAAKNTYAPDELLWIEVQSDRIHVFPQEPV